VIESAAKGAGVASATTIIRSGVDCPASQPVRLASSAPPSVMTQTLAAARWRRSSQIQPADALTTPA
jgi:hypothetical protein